MPHGSAPGTCPKHLPHASAPGKKSKIVKSPTRKSVLGAAHFMQQIVDFGILGRTMTARRSLVRTTPSAPPTLPYTTTTPSPFLRRRLWWYQVLKSKRKVEKTIGSVEFPGAPIKWRDLPRIGKAEFEYWAMTLSESLYSGSLNLSDTIEHQAKTQNKEPGTQWLNARIRRRLEEKLGRKAMIIIGWEEKIELDETRSYEIRHRLHSHIYLAINPNEIADAKEALKLAGGEVPKSFKRYQCHFREKTPDEGWLSYLGKQFNFVEPAVRAKYNATEYTGSPLYCSEEVQQLARQLFEECRADLIKTKKMGTIH